MTSGSVAPPVMIGPAGTAGLSATLGPAAGSGACVVPVVLEELGAGAEGGGLALLVTFCPPGAGVSVGALPPAAMPAPPDRELAVGVPVLGVLLEVLCGLLSVIPAAVPAVLGLLELLLAVLSPEADAV